jgi:hypothetical protein
MNKRGMVNIEARVKEGLNEMKKISLIFVLVILAISPVSFGAEFQGHKWGTDTESMMKALFERHRQDYQQNCRRWAGGLCLDHPMTQPKMDTSQRANRDSILLGRFYVTYFDDIYHRTAQVLFFFDSRSPIFQGLSRVLILWEGTCMIIFANVLKWSLENRLSPVPNEGQNSKDGRRGRTTKQM